jgi:two-component system, OmpR family, response regulator
LCAVDVALVHWPAEAERLERLRAAREPRLVIVEHGMPPTSTDELEDWLRAPADETDVRIRLATLRERASRHSDAISIDDGVLRVGNRIVVLPPIQARLAAALLERIDAVVGREALARRAWPDGAPAVRNLLDVHMAKLRRLLAGTRIDIRTVHRRGYLMHQVAADPANASTP